MVCSCFTGSSELVLNDVTIAGCRSAQTWGTDGYGGGIYLWNDDVTVTGLTSANKQLEEAKIARNKAK